MHQPGGDKKNPKEQQVVGRNYSTLRNTLHRIVEWLGLEETFKIILLHPLLPTGHGSTHHLCFLHILTVLDTGTSRGEWKLLLSFQLLSAANGGKELKLLPASSSTSGNKGETQQEGSLEQCKPEAAAPICDSQEPEQTLDDVRADD